MKKKKGVFSGVIVLFWFSLYIYMPQLTNYAKELGASYKLIGLIGGAYGLSQTIFRIPFGILSDKMKKRKIFVNMGIMFIILSSGLVYFLPGPETLLVARFLAGIASATWVNITVLYISYYDKTESSKAVGMVNANSKLGQLLAMFLGGFIALRYGVRIIFLISVITSFIALLLSLIIHDDTSMEKERKDTRPGILTVAKNKRVVHISALCALVQSITYSTTFGFTPIIAANLGADNLQLGLLSATFTLPQVIFSILAGTIMVKRLGKKNSLRIGFFLLTLACFITPFVPSVGLLFGVQLLAGIGNAISFALLMDMVVEGVESNLMTTTMGFYQAVYGIGMIFGPIILGGIGDLLGLSMGFYVIGFIGIAAMLSLRRIQEEV